MQTSEGRARYNGSVFIYEYILPIILALLELLLQYRARIIEKVGAQIMIGTTVFENAK